MFLCSYSLAAIHYRLASFFNLVLWSLEVAGSIDFHNKACVYDFLCVRLNEFFLTQMYAKIESISFSDWPKAKHCQLNLTKVTVHKSMQIKLCKANFLEAYLEFFEVFFGNGTYKTPKCTTLIFELNNFIYYYIYSYIQRGSGKISRKDLLK